VLPAPIDLFYYIHFYTHSDEKIKERKHGERSCASSFLKTGKNDINLTTNNKFLNKLTSSRETFYET
jgi:hypothetical protein